MKDGVDKFFRGRKGSRKPGLGICPGADGKNEEEDMKPLVHATMIGKRTLRGS
jgi:hypothetical protein